MKKAFNEIESSNAGGRFEIEQRAARGKKPGGFAAAIRQAALDCGVPIASHTGLIDHGTVVEENLHERFLHACTSG